MAIDMDQLCMAAREQSPVWLRLMQSVQEVLDSYIKMDVDAVAAQVAKLCTQAFPYSKVTRICTMQRSEADIPSNY